MSLQRIDPAGLHATPGYSHITGVEAGRLAFLSGQCPLDREGRLVGGDELLAQVDAVVSNTLVALEAVGAAPAQVVRTTVWVVGSDRSDLAAVWERLRASPLSDAFTSASTLVGVSLLGYPGQLIELDVVAVLPPAA